MKVLIGILCIAICLLGFVIWQQFNITEPTKSPSILPTEIPSVIEPVPVPPPEEITRPVQPEPIKMEIRYGIIIKNKHCYK